MKKKLPKNFWRWVGVAAGAFIVGFIIASFFGQGVPGPGGAALGGKSKWKGGESSGTEFETKKESTLLIIVVLVSIVVVLVAFGYYQERKRRRLG